GEVGGRGGARGRGVAVAGPRRRGAQAPRRRDAARDAASRGADGDGQRAARTLGRVEGLTRVREHGREPALGVGDAPALAARVVLDLVAADLAGAEVARGGVREVVAA